MPITLEHIHQPSAQDWLDLDKLQQECADLSDDHQHHYQRSALEQQLQRGNWIVAAKFNQRIIASYLARQHGEQIECSLPAVRQLNRQRGVLTQLNRLLEQWAHAADHSILIAEDNHGQD